MPQLPLPPEVFPAQGFRKEPNAQSAFQVGTAAAERWYSGVVSQATFTADAFGVDTPVGYPVVIGKDSIIDRIAFEVTSGGAAGSVARVGIYRATSPTNLYPSELVVDGGEHTTTGVGVKASTVEVFLKAGLYWFMYHCGVNYPTIRMVPVAALSPTFGLPSDFGANPNNRIDGTGLFSYGAFPATFPAGAALSDNFYSPLVHVRFAS